MGVAAITSHLMRPYRKETMKLKSALTTVGRGLEISVAAINNTPIRTRIAAIEDEMQQLANEKALLEQKLMTVSRRK